MRPPPRFDRRPRKILLRALWQLGEEKDKRVEPATTLSDITDDTFALAIPTRPLAARWMDYYMAARGWGDWARFLHTIVGTALTAAGASVLNQYVERDLDARMPRTSGRPLPAGRIAPVEALTLGVMFAMAGVLYLATLVN